VSKHWNESNGIQYKLSRENENEQDKRMSVYKRTKEQVVRGQLNLDVDPLWRLLPWDRQ
jgi:hypothetical protein